jgi:hypothetical protein
LEDNMTGWEEQMWAELNALPETDQIIVTAEWITRITQDVLPRLGKHRRSVVLDLLARPEWDPTKLAETIGARRGTITRLAEEGRAARREDRAIDGHPPLPVE